MKRILILVGALLASASFADLLYDQTTPFVTHPGQGFNGRDVSMCPNPPNTAGSTITSASGQPYFRIADDFATPADCPYYVTKIIVTGYMTDAAYPFPPTSPWTGINLNIWEGTPGGGGAIVATTTTLGATGWTGIYRVFNGIANLPNNQRPVMFAEAVFATPVKLDAGKTYWYDAQLTGVAPSGGVTGFSPYLTRDNGGVLEQLPGNARQLISTGWAQIIVPSTNPTHTAETLFQVHGLGPAPALATGFNVVFGSLVGGGLADLVTSNDQYMRFMNGSTFLITQSPITVEFTLDSPYPDICKLVLHHEGKVSLAGLMQRLDLRNFAKNTWDQVDERSGSLTDQTVNVTIGTLAPDYLSNADKLGVRYRVRDDNPAFLAAWTGSIDQMLIMVTRG